MCLCVQEEREDWRRFQADLQTAVVVANDIKVEAQQELHALRRQLQEEQDRNAKLAGDLEALQGVRYNLHPSPPYPGPFLQPHFCSEHMRVQLPARVEPHLTASFLYV